MGALETAQHWRNLHDPKVAGTMKTEQILKLAQLAGYSKEAAEEIAKAWAFERMSEDLEA